MDLVLGDGSSIDLLMDQLALVDTDIGGKGC